MTTSIFQEIPFSFLLEWSKTHVAVYPQLRYLQVLDTKYHLETIGDIYSSNVKECKRLSQLRDVIAPLSTVLVEAYNSSQTINVIPASSDSLTDFILGYAEIRERQLLDKQSHQSARELRAKIFRMYYIGMGDATTFVKDMDYVATALSITSSRVGQIIDEAIADCRQILMGETVGQIAATEQLSSWFKELDSKFVSTIPLSSFRKMSGLDGSNPYTERFLMDVLQATYTSNPAYIQAVYKCPITTFNLGIGKVVKFFREYAFPVPLTELDVFLNKTFKDESQKKNIRSFIMESDDYERMTDKNGIDLVALRWENLEFLSSEVARILYDNNVWDIKEAWSRERIVEEYNRLAQIHKKDQISLDVANLTRHSKLMTLGKSGFCKIRRYKETFTNGLDFAKSYALNNHGKDSLQDFLVECEEKGYIYLYGDKSMSTFYFQAMQPFRQKSEKDKSAQISSVEVIKTTASILAESQGAVKLSVLKKYVDQKLKTTIPDPSFRLFVNRASGVIWDVYPSGKRCLMVSLREVDTNTFDYSVFEPKTKESAYKSIVTATAVDELRRAEGNKIKMSKLASTLKPLIPSNIAYNNIYKIFSDNDIFIKTGEDKKNLFITLNTEKYKELYLDKAEPAPSFSVLPQKSEDKPLSSEPFTWQSLRKTLSGQLKKLLAKEPYAHIGDVLDEMYYLMSDDSGTIEEGTEFHKLLSLLWSYYTSSTSSEDRELMCLKLIFGVEPFLRSLYRKKSGNNDVQFSGLKSIVDRLQQEAIFPAENDGSFFGDKINEMLGSIISKRNKVHTNFEGFGSCSDINFMTDHFLKFYIYVSAYCLYYID